MQVEHGFGTHVLDASLPVFTEVIEAKAILFGIDQITQALFEKGPLSAIYFNFKNRILNTLAVIAASFRKSAKTSVTACFLSTYVITD